MADPFVLSQVRRLPLFAQCSPEQIGVLADAFQVVRYTAGQPLYRQGERSQALFMFASGGGQLVRTLGSGAQQVIGQVNPGEFVGEASLFAGDPRDVTAIASADSVVLLLTRQALDQALAARPDIRKVLNIRTADRSIIQVQQERGVRGDEQVLLTTRRHPWSVISRIFRAALVGVLIIAIALLLGRLPAADGFALGTGVFAVLMPILLSVYWILVWRNDFYTVTSQRVIHEVRMVLTGAVRRDQILHTAVQTVDLHRNGWLAEVLGFGDILIGALGRPNPMALRQVPNAPQVQLAIFNQTQLRAQGVLPTSSVTRGTSVMKLGGFFPRMKTVDGTRIVYHKHWVVLLRYIGRAIFGYVLLVLLLGLIGSFRRQLGALASGEFVLAAALLWLAINTLYLAWGYLTYLGDVYIIEDETLIDIRRSPLGWREYRSQAGLRQVQNVTSAIRSLVGRIFNYGDVIIQTAAGGAPGQLDFNDVSDPQGVADEILRRIQAIDDRRGAGPGR